MLPRQKRAEEEHDSGRGLRSCAADARPKYRITTCTGTWAAGHLPRPPPLKSELMRIRPALFWSPPRRSIGAPATEMILQRQLPPSSSKWCRQPKKVCIWSRSAHAPATALIQKKSNFSRGNCKCSDSEAPVERPSLRQTIATGLISQPSRLIGSIV